jgi:hypothetical protein
VRLLAQLQDRVHEQAHSTQSRGGGEGSARAGVRLT